MIVKMGQVMVVPILIDDDNPIPSDPTHDLVGHCRLSRTGAACHANAESLQRSGLFVHSPSEVFDRFLGGRCQRPVGSDFEILDESRLGPLHVA